MKPNDNADNGAPIRNLSDGRLVSAMARRQEDALAEAYQRHGIRV
jgi:hypothetical protein